MTETRNEQSFYSPYFKTFPPTVEGLPASFTPEIIKLLDGSPFQASIRSKQANMRFDWELVHQHIPQLKGHSFEEFRKYRNLISSRVFGMEIGGVKTGGMVPFAGRHPLNRHDQSPVSQTLELELQSY